MWKWERDLGATLEHWAELCYAWAFEEHLIFMGALVLAVVFTSLLWPW